MTSYHESGLIITLPDNEHFRFQDCHAYKALSRLRGRLILFDVKHVSLVDHLTAIKCNLPIAIEDSNDK